MAPARLSRELTGWPSGLTPAPCPVAPASGPALAADPSPWDALPRAPASLLFASGARRGPASARGRGNNVLLGESSETQLLRRSPWGCPLDVTPGPTVVPSLTHPEWRKESCGSRRRLRGDAFSFRNSRRLNRERKGEDWRWGWGCGQRNPGGWIGGELTKHSPVWGRNLRKQLFLLWARRSSQVALCVCKWDSANVVHVRVCVCPEGNTRVCTRVQKLHVLSRDVRNLSKES